MDTSTALMTQANLAGSSNDIANSIVTNTLLNSMKTGQPLIDAVTSLVFISKFKNQYVKNIFIVLVLIFGIIFHRITKTVDVLNVTYETIISYYDPHTIVRFIPSNRIRQMILKYNGNVMIIKAYNKNTYNEMKNQYNLLALLKEIVDKYPDVKKENTNQSELIGDAYKRIIRSNDNYLSYDDFENKEQQKETTLRLILLNIIKCPPKNGKWYKLDDDIQFNWTINNQIVKTDCNSNSGSGSGSGSVSSTGSSSVLNNQNSNGSSGQNYTTTISQEFCYVMNIKSYSKSIEEIRDYVDNLRKKLNADIREYEREESVEEQKRLNSTSNKDFKGEVYEVIEDQQKNGDPKERTYKRVLTNTFCRPLESVFFKEKEQLVNILEHFKVKKGIYEKLPHRHKIGIMIYGKPGAGKTSLSMAIATELKRNIIKVSLKDKDLDDAKLSHILSTYAKKFVVILDELDTHKAFRPRVKEEKKKEEEEALNIFDEMLGLGLEFDEMDKINDVKSNDDGINGKMDNKMDDKMGNKMDDKLNKNGEKLHALYANRFKTKYYQERLTLGSFLESMDGISTTEERVVIAMTNHPKLLDPAIIRPGRFDIVINMDSLDEYYMILYFNYLFQNFKHITDEEIKEASKYAYENKIYTATLEQACIQKYSIGNGKTLSECIKEVHESFIFE